jgi:hypothetical protein
MNRANASHDSGRGVAEDSTQRRKDDSENPRLRLSHTCPSCRSILPSHLPSCHPSLHYSQPKFCRDTSMSAKHRTWVFLLCNPPCTSNITKRLILMRNYIYTLLLPYGCTPSPLAIYTLHILFLAL